MKKQTKFIMGSSSLLLSVFLLGACGNTTSQTETNKSTTTSSSKVAEKVDLNSLDLPQLSKEVTDNEDLVEMVTTEGAMTIKLFPEQAPKAVENFMTHAKDGYYNNVPFHRIMKDFMVQSGDPEGTGMGGESIWKEEFAPEISNQLYHLNGALSMARTAGDVSEKTQGSQFYIVQNNDDQSDGLLSEHYPDKILDAYKQGGTPGLDFNYSVFGQVIEGMDTLEKIANTEVEQSPTGEASKPKKEVKIEKINILQEAKK